METYTTEAGKFAKGNPGRPKGVKEVRPRVPKALAPSEFQVLQKTAHERVIEAGLEEVAPIIKKLAEQAKAGDVPAATVLLKHIAPPIARSVIRGLEEIAHLPPDARIAAVGRAVTAGRISTEEGAAVVAIAKAEIESRILSPLRAALMSLKAGKAAAEVLAQLADVLDNTVVIEAEAKMVDADFDDCEGLV